MSRLISRTLTVEELREALKALGESLTYLVQRLYARLDFVRFSAGAVDLPNCLDGRAFGEDGEVTWWRDGDGFAVCVLWDDALPEGFCAQDWTEFPDHLAPTPAKVFLWGTRMEGVRPPRWFAQRVARADLRYPRDVPDGHDGYRVCALINRYLDPATGELLAWRMRGLEPVARKDVCKPNA